MTNPTKGTVQEQLEQFVDLYGLSTVLGMLSNICAEKAAHVAENWQDTPLAKAWDRNADVLACVPLSATH